MAGIPDVLRRLLGLETTRSGRALALVDLHDHTRGGHFGHYIRWFARELSPRFDEVYVVTPRPESTRALFEQGGAPANVSFHRLPRVMGRKKGKRFELEALRGLPGARRRHLAAFVMWGYDLVELQPPRRPSSMPWAALAGVSYLRRASDTPVAGMERRLLEQFDTEACRGFLLWDRYLRDSHAKAIWVPDHEDVSLPASPSPRAERIRAHAAGRFCVGAFGILTGYRCLDELLPLAQAQPDVRFVAVGTIREETVAPELRPLLAAGALPNLLVLPGFIPDEVELNDAIAAADATFIDGRRYPIHSGIVSKAIHSGRCIVSPRSDSWTQDLILERGVGLLYEARTDPLAEAWARWKAEGGPARSRATSEALRDPREAAACFDRLADELTKGMGIEEPSSRSPVSTRSAA